MDIDKILSDLVVPEMECDPHETVNKPTSRKKTKTAAPPRSVTLDDVPEVVLPKTKAEVYNEAKDRLTEKTSAVSRTKKPAVKRPVAPTDPAVPRVRTEVAAVRAERPRRVCDRPVWVGEEQELIPFAWRNPLIPDIARPSKFYRQAVRDANNALIMLPVPRDK